MKIRDFGVEIWMNRYETTCEWNLAETCVESLTVEELLDMAGKTDTILSELLPLKLTYGAIEGSERLRNLVAGLYERQAMENVVITHGAIGANALVHETLVEPGDRFTTGDVLYTVETEKVSHDVEATADGTLLEVLVPLDEDAEVGQPVCVVDLL